MKKLFLIPALFLFLLANPHNISAGPLCDAQGGICRPACLSGENDLGQLDCPSGGGPFGNFDCCTTAPIPPGGGGTGGTSITCNGGEGIETAIGCIPFGDETSFISYILSWAIGIGGGVAFILMLAAGFQIMTSAGNPDRLRAGQELLTSAIAGLILLVFSVFILRVIGMDILGIPLGK